MYGCWITLLWRAITRYRLRSGDCCRGEPRRFSRQSGLYGAILACRSIMLGMEFSAALLHKYCKAGPRYSSYPTAPYVHESFGPAQWEEELRASQHRGRDISLYVHIPFCDTLCYYCGCNMIATKNYSKAESYLDVLFREIDHVAALTSNTRKVRQLHWGGGTPTYLHPDDIRRLYDYLASH